MKKSIIASAALILILFISISCEKNQSNSNCYSAKILKISCGGTVLQILGERTVGEEWRDVESDVFYKNCVLTGIISSENKVIGDVIFLEFNKVDSFSSGNFCDIGGLPSIKIEIKNLFSKSCSN